MAKLVIELQKECLNPALSYANLFQKAYFIAQKLEQKEMVDFLKNEINGYKNIDELPDIRYVDLTYKAFNPMRGWIPFQIPSTGIYSKLLKGPIFLSVGEMQKFLDAEDSVLNTVVPFELQRELIKNSNMFFDTEIKAFFSKTQLVRILDAVKNQILDWSIDLERKGILGEDYIFSEKEKEIAKTMTLIVNGNVNGANIVGSMTNSSATVNNNGKLDFESLRRLVEQIKKEMEKAQTADSEKVIALKEKVELLERSIGNRDESSVIETLKNIAIGAVSSGFWQVGAMVSSYISTMMG